MNIERQISEARAWQRVKPILQAALELSPEERAGYLSEACAGDAALRDEIVSLIAAYEQSGGFLAGSLMDSPAFELVSDPALHQSEQSATLIGREFGHYQVLEPIGRGGMGEVYRARDVRLGREAAIKLLPPAVAADQSRLRRFEQEARASSALNHPNIITIYEIGEEQGLHFIVTELIDGRTLRSYLADGKLTTVATLDIAIQIASALAAAHEAGIIHRDIKPENVMIRRDQIVKVLDFGLVKLTERQPVEGDEDGATPAKLTTEPGAVMGTPQYMSPEQARGLKADARTDIFSLGVVLYEMIAGHAPFEGVNAIEVMAAILNREPTPLGEHPAGGARELERIVNKALSKDREERYLSARDFLSDLKSLREELGFAAKLEREGQRGASADFETTNVASDSNRAQPQLRLPRPTLRISLATVLLVVIAGLAFGVYSLIARRPTRPAVVFQDVKLTRLTTTGKESLAAITPDGRYLAHVTSGGLWLRQTAVESDKQIVEPGGLSYSSLAFSRDGDYLYFTATEKASTEPALYQMPTLGGAPRKLFDRVRGRPAFSPDGRQIAFVRLDEGARKGDASFSEDRLVIANANGGEERVLAVRKFPEIFFYGRYADGLAWSPDGKLIAVSAGTWAGGYRLNPVAVRVADGKELPLPAQQWHSIMGMAWLSDGSGLLLTASHRPVEARQIWHVSLPGGEARKVTNDLSEYIGASLTADARAFVTVQMESLSNLWVVNPADPLSARQITSVSGRQNGDYGLAWTPDGRIVYASKVNGQLDLWVTGLDDSGSKQLTDDEYTDEFPSVAPDGRWLVWTTNRASGRLPNIWRMDVDGGNPKQLTSGSNNLWSDLSPDGRWVVYYSFTHSLWKVPAEGGAAIQLTGKLSVTTAPAISPDGKLIAYVFREEQPVTRQGVALISFEGGPVLNTITLPPTAAVAAFGVRWTPDGRALSYIDTRNGVSNVWSQPVDGGPSRQLTHFNELRIGNFAWSRDGRLALSRRMVNSDVVMISNLR
jgi:serine/threonine protein kinase/Tol biopolymer transport system component